MSSPDGHAGFRVLPAALRFVRDLTAESSSRVALTLVLAIAVAVTEGLGLLLLLPLLEMAGVTMEEGAAGTLTREVSSRLNLQTGSASLAAMLGLYAAIMGGRALLVRFSVVSCVRVQEQFLLARRQRLYRAMLESRWERVAGQRAGELSRSLTADLENAADAPSDLLALITGGLLVVVYLALALELSATITLFGVVSGVALLFVFRRRRSEAHAAAETAHEITAELFAAAAEHVDGLKTTKAYGAERRTERMFATQSKAVADATERCERLFADARAFFDTGAVMVLAVSVYVAHSVLNVGTGAVLVLLYIVARLTPRLAELQSTHQALVLAMVPFARVSRAIDQWEAAAEGTADEGSRMQLQRALVLRGIRYHYRDDREGTMSAEIAKTAARSPRPPALRDVSLTISAGATTAVVGPSGAGKSTLADIVLGLLFPQAGCVELDGVELTTTSARAWRERVGYVAQEPYLFNDTIRANLLWACPSATEVDLWEALALASADQFVAALPDSLDTVVGERGQRLSCGERQRLTLARALLRRPELLMLDEAMSSVDAENEQEIQRAVESLKGRTTMLVITHRLATTRAADAIYVMDRGRIVERGTFETLVRRGGRFAALCRAQGLHAGPDGTTPPSLVPDEHNEYHSPSVVSPRSRL